VVDESVLLEDCAMLVDEVDPKDVCGELVELDSLVEESTRLDGEEDSDETTSEDDVLENEVVDAVGELERTSLEVTVVLRVQDDDVDNVSNEKSDDELEDSCALDCVDSSVRRLDVELSDDELDVDVVDMVEDEVERTTTLAACTPRAT
jgi:hypothetical protein